MRYEDRSAILYPDKMKVGIPYPFTFEGHTVWAVRREDGTLEAYYSPDLDAALAANPRAGGED